MPIELKVPTVGESVTEVEIGSWLVKQGEFVKQDDPVVEIESEKATVEIYAPTDGKVTEIIKDTGESAEVGELIGYMEEAETPTKTKKDVEKEEPAKKEPTQAKSKSEPEPAVATTRKKQKEREEESPRGDGADVAVMPAAKRLLAENGLDAKDVEATGPGGRLLKEDVLRYLEEHEGQPAAAEAEEPAPKPATPSDGDRQEESVRMTPMRRRIAEHLVRAQQTAALLTTFNECDMSAVIDLRNQYKDPYQKEYGIKLGFMSFFVKACVEALKQYPQVNAEVRGEEIVYKNYYDIGIAVGGGKGLVVPVLRNAERMSFAEIELAIADFGRRAQENKITLEELQGGTFTISNGGIYGSMLSTPIVNAPQSGILGMHAIEERPVVHDGEIVARPMMYVALTYDHRIVDGREAVQFLVRIKECIENPSRILLEI